MLRRLRTGIEGSTDRLAIAILAGCALIAFSPWATADSTPRRQARSTHMGVAASDFVTLTTLDSSTNSEFRRIEPDASRAGSEFEVPDGHVLVVTDVEWVGELPAYSSGTTRIFVENLTTPSQRSIVFVSTDQVNFKTSNEKTGGVGTGIATGFVVHPGTRLVVDGVDTRQNPATAGFGGDSDLLVIVRGYLVRDE